MSSDNSLINLLKKVVISNSFANFSTIYFGYLKIAGGIGGAIGLGLSIAHLMDSAKSNKRTKARIMDQRKLTNDYQLTEDEISKCENSNFYNLSIVVAGSVVGSSGGIMWPAVITFGPLYYIFGNYLGTIVSSMLAISACMIEEDSKSNRKHTKSDSEVSPDTKVTSNENRSSTDSYL